jgi:hypothetical protein
MGIGLKRGVAGLIAAFPLIAQAAIWHDADQQAVAAKGVSAAKTYYRALQADRAALQSLLSSAPSESSFQADQGQPLELPMPDGQMQRFWVEVSPIMAPTLAERYPEITTYRVKGIDVPATTGRLDLTPRGFHAMLSTPAGTVFIDPDRTGLYRSFYKADYAKSVGSAHPPHICQHHPEHQAHSEDQSDVTAALVTHSSDQRRVYRLAVAATGEYTAYFDNSKSEALAQIVTAINRVNQIYGRDLAIQFQLVGNNHRIIYSDASSDPYSHSSSLIPTMLIENQNNLDHVLGADNYDIGHLFGIVGGGLASVGSACGNAKAQAYTGTSKPDSDVFYIDFVAHELGHQLNANHSFNGTTANCGGVNRVGSTAVEPGSGSTIMSYAGICGGENLQLNSNATFHAVSIQEIRRFVAVGGGQLCGTVVSTENRAPSVDAGRAGEDGVYTIPAGTPFRLTGEASDIDGDTLSYQWDEMDVGGETGGTDATTLGTDIPGEDNPLFRSYRPKATPERYFPRLTTLITGDPEIGETLPQTERQLNFRLTVRDGESGVASDDLEVAVDNRSGSFEVTGGSINSGGRFSSGSTQSIGWSTAATEQSCPEVEISLLSLNESDPPTSYCDYQDSGFEQLNLGRFPNTGSALLELPDITLSRGRMMLACADGLFFALSGASLEISGGALSVANDCKPLDGENQEHGTIFNDAGGATKFESPGGGGLIGWLNLLMGLIFLSRWQDRIKL